MGTTSAGPSWRLPDAMILLSTNHTGERPMTASDDVLWRHRREHAWHEDDHAPDWPDGVHALSEKGVLLLGRDAKGRLYWDGEVIEVRRTLDLTWWQKALATATAAAVILAGLNGLVQAVSTTTDYGCRQGWWTRACVLPARSIHG